MAPNKKLAFVIACCGQKGGSGKSMVTRVLAAELARKKHGVAIVDLDIDQRTVTEWAKARAANKIEPSISVETVDPDDEPDFFIQELSAGADYLICDAPGWSDEITLRLGGWSDLIVLPSEPSVDDLRPTMRLYHELVGADIRPERIAIVLNRIRSEAEVKFASDYLEKGQVKALLVEMPDQPIYRQRANLGQAPTEVGSDGPKAAARAVADALLKRLAKVGKHDQSSRGKQEAVRFTMKQGEKW